MLIVYFLTFCRVVIGLIFLLAFIRKISDIRAFAQTIANFGLLPHGFSIVAALACVCSEAAVVVLLTTGLIVWGLALASLLLFMFSMALISVIIRNIRTPCSCFGPTERPVTSSNVWRNGVLIICALAALVLYATSPGVPVQLNLSEWGLITVVAALFVAVWLQWGEIAHLVRPR